jgi:hypothetical protein
MHERKTELSGMYGTTCMPNALKNFNVLRKDGSLREPLNDVVKAAMRSSAVGPMVDMVLGKKGVCEKIDVDHEDVLVMHLNFYGHGRQVLAHSDFEGSRWREARQGDTFRLGIRPSVAEAPGEEYTSTFRTGLGINPAGLGMHWRSPARGKNTEQEYGEGDGPGEPPN